MQSSHLFIGIVVSLELNADVTDFDDRARVKLNVQEVL